MKRCGRNVYFKTFLTFYFNLDHDEGGDNGKGWFSLATESESES